MQCEHRHGTTTDLLQISSLVTMAAASSRRYDYKWLSYML
jgi:hypothetical protein